MKADEALQDYFRNAVSWDEDRAASLRRGTRVAWRVAGAGWACAVFSAAALLLLMPLKRVEPFVVRVDNGTGIVDVVPVYAGEAPMDEAVTRYFLSHYIHVCERFNFATAESDYEECGAFHTAGRNQQWSARWSLTNPDSPLNVHKDGSTVHAQVESISFFARAGGGTDLAQVRYVKSHRPGNAAPAQFSHWIATLQYVYGQVPKDPRSRRWNPLGFKIIEFVTEPEVLARSRDTPDGASSQAGRREGAVPGVAGRPAEDATRREAS